MSERDSNLPAATIHNKPPSPIGGLLSHRPPLVIHRYPTSPLAFRAFEAETMQLRSVRAGSGVNGLIMRPRVGPNPNAQLRHFATSLLNQHMAYVKEKEGMAGWDDRYVGPFGAPPLSIDGQGSAGGGGGAEAGQLSLTVPAPSRAAVLAMPSKATVDLITHAALHSDNQGAVLAIGGADAAGEAGATEHGGGGDGHQLDLRPAHGGRRTARLGREYLMVS